MDHLDQATAPDTSSTPGTPGVFPVSDLLGLRIDACDRDGFCRWIVEASASRRVTTRVTYVNAATVNLAAEHRAFFDLLQRFDHLVADGQSVVWATRFLGAAVPERVNVTDVVGDVIRLAAGSGVRLALIGGRAGEADRFADAMRARCPQIEIVMTSPGYLDESSEHAVRQQIRATDPDLVLLGMGAPRQEQRVATWSRADAPRVWWCVGAVFEYFAGTRRRAPVWVRRIGLEWLVRLVQEPRRLSGRYLIGNPMFVIRVIRRRPLWPAPI